MASYCPRPGLFKRKDAEPEVTLELFTDYLDTMEMVFMLSRRINPTNGNKIEFDDAEKKVMLQIEGGEDMRDLFKYVGKVEEADTYAQAVEKIKAALKARGNRTSAVFRLFNQHPQGSQTFDSWHKTVYKAANLIDWTGYNAEKAAVDAIIMQTSSLKLQQRAIQENPNYEDLVNLGISQEQAKKKATVLPDGESEIVQRLKQENEKLKSKGQGQETAKKNSCSKCGNGRCKGSEQCFARDKECNHCHEVGHFIRQCPKKKNTKKAGGNISRRIKEAEASGSESEKSVGRILQSIPVGRVGAAKGDIFTKLSIQGVAGFKVATDTGVGKTILSRADWRKIEDRAEMVKTRLKFRPYGTEQQLPIRGRARVKIRAEAGAEIDTYVYVNDDGKETSLLGKEDAVRLGIVTMKLEGAEKEYTTVSRIRQNRKTDFSPGRSQPQGQEMEQMLAKYSHMFKGIGKYVGDPVKIQVKEGISPVNQPPRRIPLQYVEPLKEHVAELVEADVVEGPLQEEEEGTWISNLVITEKKWDKDRKEGERRQIRANLDCRPLNKYVYQTHEPIPTLEELRHELMGSNKFSTLDMVHSFHQFELEEKARKLFTFRTPWGLYRFKRMVMGNSPASSEAHRRVRTVIQGCKGVVQIKDDVLVHGVGAEHDKNLEKVLQRFDEAGLTFRREKCLFGVSEVKWFGMIFSEIGMEPDPEKTRLIREWPAPKTVRDVKSFLQTVQFNAVYMAAEEGEKNYAELTAPLRALTTQKARFTWTEEHEENFKMIKERLCSDRVMVPYDVTRKTRIYTDGGPEGCQATVAQEYLHETAGVQWRPVAHTARAWTEPEKRYSQIEKESLALYSGVVSNKMYLLGSKFEAVVDHQPLLPLYNRPARPKQMRVDRHRMKLAGYDFEVVYEPGSRTPCDYGSRRGCPGKVEYKEGEKLKYGVEDDNEIYVNSVGRGDSQGGHQEDGAGRDGEGSDTGDA